ncbi:MAG: hypothetical protein ACRCUY_12115 [Thermoguttaceae bacterium]
MTAGINTTLQILSQSKNEAAQPLLEMALRSSSEMVRAATGHFMAMSQGNHGIRGLIRSFNPEDTQLTSILASNHRKIVPILSNDIKSLDEKVSQKALQVAVMQDCFELLPSVILSLVSQDSNSNIQKNKKHFSKDIIALTDKFVLAANSTAMNRATCVALLPEIMDLILRGLRQFHETHDSLLLSIFLRIYPIVKNNYPAVAMFLNTDDAPSLRAIVTALDEFPTNEVANFVLTGLRQANAPSVVIELFCKRKDPPFLELVLSPFADDFTKEMRRNVSMITKLEWLSRLPSLLETISEKAQIGLVALFVQIYKTPNKLFPLLRAVFASGKTGGRRAALLEVSKFQGDEMDAMIEQAADDADPIIQRESLFIIQKRGIPNSQSIILRQMNSPHQIVRDTVAQLMPSLRFSRYMAIFDSLSDAQRRQMFNLIKQVDSSTENELRRLLLVGDDLQKTIALMSIEYGEMVPVMENALCEVLTKERIPKLRKKAAELLVDGCRDVSRMTLVNTFHRDSSPEVRQSAQNSLAKRPASWNKRNESN